MFTNGGQNLSVVEVDLFGNERFRRGAMLLKQVNKLDLPGQRRHTAKRPRKSAVRSDQTSVESNGQGYVEGIIHGLSARVRQCVRILGQRPARHRFHWDSADIRHEARAIFDA